MKDYYNVNDVINITGKSQSKCYGIIRGLQKSFHKKFPDAVFIKGRIPSWYFEETMGNKRKEN